MKFLLMALLLFGQYTQPLHVPFHGGASAPDITYVNGCVNSASALTTSCTLSVTEDNLLVVASKTQNSSGTGTVAFTTSGISCDWKRAMSTTDSVSGSPFNATVYTCIAPATASATVTVTWAGTTTGPFTDLSVSQWNTTSTWNDPVLDRWAQSSNTTSTTSCPTGTTEATQNPYDLVLAICQNFDSAETWGALAGWTNQSSASRNTLGLYSTSVSATGTQSATIPLSAADTSQGAVLAFQASNVTNCAGCVLVQYDNSAGSGELSDFIALNGVVPGDTLVYYVFHSDWSGSGTTTMTDSGGNTWFPCNTNTGGGTSATMTDLQLNSTYGMSCFYSIAVSSGGTVTGEPLPSDCASNCAFVGGVFMEFSGPHAWEAFSNTAPSATSGSGSNNLNCGSITTTTPNDLLLCGVDTASGTPTAGTTPISFTLFNNVNGAMENGVWSGSGTTSMTETVSGSGIAYGAMGVAFR
jgi:hypothetical protein